MDKIPVIERVSTERWRDAQQWEQRHWIKAQAYRARFFKNHLWRLLSRLGLVEKYRGDDWNRWWKTAFADYSFLPPVVNNAIEVGCGPYSNVRLIMDRCHPNHLILSDPLIRTYAKFQLTFVAQQYQEVACMLDDHPIEELPFSSDYFDLSVMINVLDHVRDAHQCMANLIRITRPGGYLILGQDLTNEEDLAKMKNTNGEIGHPIKLSAEWFEPYLKEGFEHLQYCVLPRNKGRAPEHHYGTLLFAGRKSAGSDTLVKEPVN